MNTRMVLINVAVGAALFGDQIGAKECTPRQIDEAVVNGKLETALTLTQHCIESEQAELETRARSGRKAGLAETNTGAFMIAKVEILALKGDSADSAIADAEKFDQEHPDAGINWNMNGTLLSRAKAFVLEKKGDLDRATLAYEAILAEDKKGGWWDVTNTVQGRLAIIALLKGDYTAVERWANDKNILKDDAGANAAMGTMLQKRGDLIGAKKYYTAAIELMSNRAKGNNWSLPIYFAEWKRAKDGVKQTQR